MPSCWSSPSSPRRGRSWCWWTKQTFTPDGGLLLNLHNQETFSVQVVCGGLSDTEDRLRRIGLTRLGDESVLNLGPLAADETRACVEGTLARFAADESHVQGDFGDWTLPLAEASDNWPQHLALYLNAARGEADGRGAFNDGGLGAALEHGAAARERYYGQRLVLEGDPASPSSALDPRVALAAHRAASERAVRRTIALRTIETAVLGLPQPDRDDHEQRFPEGAGQCVDAMFHSGLMERTRDGKVVGTRIPSLRSYLERQVAEIEEFEGTA